MRRLLTALLCTIAAPAWGQAKVWSEAPRTGTWSSAPTPAPQAPTGGGAGRTEQWSAPVHTRRRSDEDVPRQVDGLARDAERRARVGATPMPPNGQAVPDRIWRDHMDRMRAQDQFQREQDAHNQRQRYHNPR